MSGKGDTYRKLTPEQRKAFEDNFDAIFGKKEKPKYSEDWQSEKRDKTIAQNGNVGYDEKDVLGE